MVVSGTNVRRQEKRNVCRRALAGRRRALRGAGGAHNAGKRSERGRMQVRARGRRARANSAWGPRPRGNHTWFKGIVPRRQRGPQGLVAAPTAVALVRAALGAGARACNSTRLVLDVYKRASTAKREGGGGLREFARCGREGGRLGMHESKKLHPGTEGSRGRRTRRCVACIEAAQHV